MGEGEKRDTQQNRYANTTKSCGERGRPERKHIALIDKILSKAEVVVDGELNVFVDMFGKPHKAPVIDAGKLETIMKVIEKAQKGHRLALGLDEKDAEEEGKIEITIKRKEKRDG